LQFLLHRFLMLLQVALKLFKALLKMRFRRLQNHTPVIFPKRRREALANLVQPVFKRLRRELSALFYKPVFPIWMRSLPIPKLG
jgi:hypothetical protein